MKSFHYYQVGETVRTVTVQAEGDGFVVMVGERVYRVKGRLLAAGQVSFSLEGQQVEAHVVRQQQERLVAIEGKVWRLQPVAARREGSRPTVETRSGRVEASMPGTVRAVGVKVGEVVRHGQSLLLLEAMKMELQVTAPCDGQIGYIHCQPGQIVERGALLLEISCGE